MKRVVIILLVLWSSVSCVKDISLDAEERAVVVHCILTNDSPQRLVLGLTKGAGQSAHDKMPESVATLTDLTDSCVVGNFELQEDSLWTLDYTAIPDHLYRLEVSVSGYEKITAEQKMPAFEVKQYYTIREDNGGYSNKDGYYYSNRYGMYTSSPIWICGVNYDLATCSYSMVEDICLENDEVVDKYNLTGSVYSPEIRYDGFKDVYSYLYPNLKGNNLHRRYLRISRPPKPVDTTLENYFEIAGSFAGGWTVYGFEGNSYPQPDIEAYVIFNAVSHDYDHYLKELSVYLNTLNSKDIAQIYMREDFYTNIQGGVGLFGAMIRESLRWYRLYYIETDQSVDVRQ